MGGTPSEAELPQIEVKNLGKRYGRVSALQGLSFATRGSWGCLGILGRNGAGKTTFLKILVGLIGPTEGSVVVRYKGRTYSHLDARMAPYIAENQTIIPSFTGYQYLDIYEAMNVFARTRTDRALRARLIDELELGEHIAKPTGRMSKGTRRKLELVAALSTDSPMIVADELGEGLDIPTVERIRAAFASSISAGKKFVVSSHDLSFMLSVCDTIAVIDHGKCVEMLDCSPKDLSGARERIISAFERPRGSAPCA